MIEDLDDPRSIDCLMIKTPLKKVNRAFTTVFFMWLLMFCVYIALSLFIFPCKFADNFFTIVVSISKYGRDNSVLLRYLFSYFSFSSCGYDLRPRIFIKTYWSYVYADALIVRCGTTLPWVWSSSNRSFSTLQYL